MSKFYYISRNDFLGWWIFETNHKKRMLLTKTSSETIYPTAPRRGLQLTHQVLGSTKSRNIFKNMFKV